MIVFEPSGAGDPGLFVEALALTHILKYSSERVHNFKELLSEAHPLLEIETLGKEGLRYRGRSVSASGKVWHKLAGYRVASVKDTAGAGDWCTAGIIHRFGQGGLKNFQKIDADSVHDALRFGQAMAAWTCGFEGARGGMYQLGKKAFQKEINTILERSKSPKIIESDSSARKGHGKVRSSREANRRSPQSQLGSHRAACCF